MVISVAGLERTTLLKRPKDCVQKENRPKLGKSCDYYYLSNRTEVMIEVVFSSRVSLLAFCSEQFLSAQVCSLACLRITWGSLTEDKINKSGYVNY